jgi:SAM-dependent methyltransferase
VEGRVDPTAALHEVLPRFWRSAGLVGSALEGAQFASRRFEPILAFFGPAETWDGRRILDLGGGIGSLSVATRATFGGTHALADRVDFGGALGAALSEFGVAERYPIDLAQPHPLASLPSDFDLVLCVEVLEHLLVNPLPLFHEVYDHLRPDGRFFVTTPNQARVGNRAKLLLGRSIKESERYPPDDVGGYGHVMEYTAPELDHLLAAESFRLERGTVHQHLPSKQPSRSQRIGARLLNHPAARRLALGDDMLRLYRKVSRPAPGTPRPPRI